LRGTPAFVIPAALRSTIVQFSVKRLRRRCSALGLPKMTLCPAGRVLGSAPDALNGNSGSWAAGSGVSFPDIEHFT
jgi:hypothetical protein